MLILNIFWSPRIETNGFLTSVLLNLPKAPTAITNQLPLSTDPSHALHLQWRCHVGRIFEIFKLPRHLVAFQGRAHSSGFQWCRMPDLVIAKIRTPKGYGIGNKEHPVDSQTSYIAHQATLQVTLFGHVSGRQLEASFFCPQNGWIQDMKTAPNPIGPLAHSSMILHQLICGLSHYFHMYIRCQPLFCKWCMVVRDFLTIHRIPLCPMMSLLF